MSITKNEKEKRDALDKLTILKSYNKEQNKNASYYYPNLVEIVTEFLDVDELGEETVEMRKDYYEQIMLAFNAYNLIVKEIEKLIDNDHSFTVNYIASLRENDEILDFDNLSLAIFNYIEDDKSALDLVSDNGYNYRLGVKLAEYITDLNTTLFV